MVKLFINKMVAVLLIIILLTALLASYVQTPSFASYSSEETDISYDEYNHPYKTGQLIVGYRSNSTAEEKRSIRAAMKLELKTKINGINAEVIKVENERAREVLNQLNRNPNISFAEYDYIASIDHVPNDVRYEYQVYLHYMNAEKAWDYTIGTADTKVAILDTGIITNNTDLHNINMAGYNISDSITDYTDSTGHGTAVISVIAAEMDNTFGFAGVAPKSSFLVLKVIDEQGYSTYSDLIKALEYATNQGVDVINMSVSGRSDSLSLKMAIDNAYNNGITIVAAAGNESSTTVSYPAAYNNVIGVGAVDTTGEKMTFSNTGDGLTVVAGGTAMIATSTDYITSASGTSFASPYVTGLVALMYSVDPNMTPARVFEILAATSTDLGSSGYDTTFGYGVINMGAAVSMASNGTITPTPEPNTDITPPVITLIGESQLSIGVGSTYIEQGAEAFDDVDGDITNNIMISGMVDESTPGTYVLEYSVTDQAGNLSDIIVRTITVISVPNEFDTTPPIITLNGNSTVDVEIGTSYIELGAQAIDDFDGDISNEVVIEGFVDVSTVGFYSLDYYVTDHAGNKSNTVTRTVEVFEYVVIAEETEIVRDVEIIEGSLSRRDSEISHMISITEPGQLDIELSYKGKSKPVLSIDNQIISGDTASLNLTEGNYNMVVSADSSVKFTVKLTYPEREVPVGTPAGSPDIINYQDETNYTLYIFIVMLFMVVLTTLYIYFRRKNSLSEH